MIIINANWLKKGAAFNQRIVTPVARTRNIYNASDKIHPLCVLFSTFFNGKAKKTILSRGQLNINIKVSSSIKMKFAHFNVCRRFRPKIIPSSHWHSIYMQTLIKLLNSFSIVLSSSFLIVSLYSAKICAKFCTIRSESTNCMRKIDARMSFRFAFHLFGLAFSRGRKVNSPATMTTTKIVE